jgi:putative ABC transport system substrate-binding protein
VAVPEGALLSFSPSLTTLWRKAGGYVGRILAGGQPATMPIEQPTIFELAINLKTAKSLGLVLSPALLVRADEVIE